MSHLAVALMRGLLLLLAPALVAPLILVLGVAVPVPGLPAPQLHGLLTADRPAVGSLSLTRASGDGVTTAPTQPAAPRVGPTDRLSLALADDDTPPVWSADAGGLLHRTTVVMRRAPGVTEHVRLPRTRLLDGRAPPPDRHVQQMCLSAAAPGAAGPGGPPCPALVGSASP